MKKVLFIAVIGILLFSTVAFAQSGFVSPDQVMPNAPHMVNNQLFRNVPFIGASQMNSYIANSSNGFIGMGDNNYIAYVHSVFSVRGYKLRAFKMVNGRITQKGPILLTEDLDNKYEPVMVSLSATNAVFCISNYSTSLRSYCVTLNPSTLTLTMSAAHNDTTASYICGIFLNLMRYSDTQAILTTFDAGANKTTMRYINTSAGSITSVSGHVSDSFSYTSSALHSGMVTDNHFTSFTVNNGSNYIQTVYANGSGFTRSAFSTTAISPGTNMTGIFFRGKGRATAIAGVAFAYSNNTLDVGSTNPVHYVVSNSTSSALYNTDAGDIYQKISIAIDDTYAVLLGVRSNSNMNVPILFLLGFDNEQTVTTAQQINANISICDIKYLVNMPIDPYVTGGTSQANRSYTPFVSIYLQSSSNYSLSPANKNYWYYDSNEKILYFGAPWGWQGNQEGSKANASTFMIVPIKIEIDEAGARFGTLNLK